MPLTSDLDDFFADGNEIIVKEPLRFKAKLGIGEQAYGLIRAREKMATFSEAIGLGTAASVVTGSGVVAGVVFAKTGFMASALSVVGLGGAAVTPVGWVIAAGVITGGAYIGVSRLFERSKDSGLVIVPKFINTPLDVIAVALIESMLPVSLKIANSDGDIDDRELRAIQEFFVDEWGFSPEFVAKLTEEYLSQLDSVSYVRLAESLGAYCSESRDCDKETIISGFVAHLREIIEADGLVREQENQQLDYLTGLLNEKARRGGARDP